MNLEPKISAPQSYLNNLKSAPLFIFFHSSDCNNSTRSGKLFTTISSFKYDFSGSRNGDLSFGNCYFYLITLCFSKLLSNSFQHTNDIAYTAVIILDSHIHNTSIIRYTIKGHMNFSSSASKLFSDIIREFNICSTFIRNKMYLSFIFIEFYFATNLN
mgnify:CR=1 FL=1